MNDAVIVDAIRTPMARGRATGALVGVHPTDLLASTLKALIERSGIDPGTVDDVIVGCVTQSGEQSSTPGRQAWLAAGFPEHVPSVTVERKCGSSQQALDFAVQGTMAGAYDIVVVAGIESMSRVPMGSSRQGQDPYGVALHERYPHILPQGVSAELVARKWNLTRDDLDRYAARSHSRAAYTAASGGFEREIVPISTAAGVVDADETIRPSTDVARLAELSTAFDSDEWRTLYPDMDWKITAGNSSQLTDGAGALLVMSAAAAESVGLTPRARVVASAVCGDDPIMMLTGPIPATRKALARAGLTTDDIDAFEVNEAFASVPLAWQAEFGVEDARLNPRGGAIALGHPLGASGVRLMTTLINHLEQTGGRYGLQSMCEAGGMANATIIERIA